MPATASLQSCVSQRGGFIREDPARLPVIRQRDARLAVIFSRSATEDEIVTAILPHFAGIREKSGRREVIGKL